MHVFVRACVCVGAFVFSLFRTCMRVFVGVSVLDCFRVSSCVREFVGL